MERRAPVSDTQWRRMLTPEQFRVLREAGTETPFTNEYWDDHADGTYVCAGCGSRLYDSRDKFDSGTGWPSFTRPRSGDPIEERSDTSNGTLRTEVRCASCGGHLGHVFEDGPAPGRRRHCINSVALRFVGR